MSVDREYLSKAGRRRDAMRRVDERLALIKGAAFVDVEPRRGQWRLDHLKKT